MRCNLHVSVCLSERCCRIPVKMSSRNGIIFFCAVNEFFFFF